MRSNTLKSHSITSGLAVSLLLLAGGAAFAQQQVNLAAGPATAALPDGSPGADVGLQLRHGGAGSTATCAALNPKAGGLVSRGDHRADAARS